MTAPIPNFDAWWQTQGQPPLGRRYTTARTAWNAAVAWVRARAECRCPAGEDPTKACVCKCTSDYAEGAC